jgi:hypothetical protein
MALNIDLRLMGRYDFYELFLALGFGSSRAFRRDAGLGVVLSLSLSLSPRPPRKSDCESPAAPKTRNVDLNLGLNAGA